LRAAKRLQTNSREDLIQLPKHQEETQMNKNNFSLVWTFVSCALLLGATAPSYAAVDEAVLKGRKVYERGGCEGCHGPGAEGAAAFPNLVNSLKTLSKEQFTETVLNGKGAMRAFKDNKLVVEGMDNLYTYVKARSDGTVPGGKLE
jgi:mono/diheme cytochrome c family protein